MKHRIMALVNLVATIDIGRQKPFPLTSFENLYLVRRGMRAKYSLLVQVICICSTSARVVRPKPEVVKVLFGGDDGR
jgi:hypothetical protein